MRNYLLCVMLGSLLSISARPADSHESAKVNVNWDKPDRISQTSASVLYIPGWPDRRGTKMHDQVFGALRDLHSDFDTYLGWNGSPLLVVAELKPPQTRRTFWDFTNLDPYVEDFMEATKGHPIALDMSTIPEWMFKTDKPIPVPDDPATQSPWYQGNELRDPTCKELAEYYARLASWYMRGGFGDENGEWHASGHRFKVQYWGVLNEVDLEHETTPEQYTQRYDAIVEAVRQVAPEMKFAGPYLGWGATGGRFYEFFLDPKNHKSGIPIDMLTYHFFALPAPDEDFNAMVIDVFGQADRFLNDVGYIEQIRKRLAPQAQTSIDELGVMLTEESVETGSKPIPDDYWNLYGASWAYEYAELSRLGIEVVGMPQLFGFPGRAASSTLVDWRTGKPNSAYWVLKMIRENVGSGGELFDADVEIHPEPVFPPKNAYVYAMGYKSIQGDKKILLINRRNRRFEVNIPNAAGAHVEIVDESTAFDPPKQSTLSGDQITLGGLAVAVITLK